MALLANVAQTPTSGGISLVTQTPGGVYDLTVVNNTGQVVFLGTSATKTSSTDGCPLLNGQAIKVTGVAGGAAGALYATLASGGATGTLGYVLVTNQ